MADAFAKGANQSGSEVVENKCATYQMAKRCNEKRVMAQSVEWGKRGARLNDIAPGKMMYLSGESPYSIYKNIE